MRDAKRTVLLHGVPLLFNTANRSPPRSPVQLAGERVQLRLRTDGIDQHATIVFIAHITGYAQFGCHALREVAETDALNHSSHPITPGVQFIVRHAASAHVRPGRLFHHGLYLLAKLLDGKRFGQQRVALVHHVTLHDSSGLITGHEEYAQLRKTL